MNPRKPTPTIHPNPPVTTKSVSNSEPGALGARIWLILAAITVIATMLRAIQAAIDFQRNPFATQPIEDALVYWKWAGEISRGSFLGSTPFLSAPLYPYLLAVPRALGAGLGTVVGLQVAMNGLTIFLLGMVAHRRFGLAAGCLTAVIFALLAEPAYFAGRILAPTLQALVVALLLIQLNCVERRSSWVSWLVVGVISGLLALTYAPAVLIGPLLALWIFIANGPRRGWAPCAGCLVGTFVTIAPATIHNWLASHEFILISAQSGVTFAQGNGSGAEGIYRSIPGISDSREQQNLDVLRVYQEQTGLPPSWKKADSFFFQKGFSNWRQNPAAAVALTIRKLAWFLTGTNYGDIYCPALERVHGFSPASPLSPVPVPWLIPLALAGILLARRDLRFLELLLLLIPLIVVLAFFYSPRYRFPAIPVLAMFAAVAVVRLWTLDRMRRGLRLGLLLILVVLGPAVELAKRQSGFDQLATYEPHFQKSLASALERSGSSARSMEMYRSALRLRPDDPTLIAGLANGIIQSGKPGDAMLILEPAVRRFPNEAALQDQMAHALGQMNRLEAALPYARRAVELNGSDPRYQNDLGWVLIGLRQFFDARTSVQAAIRLQPDYAEAILNLGIIDAAEGNIAGATEKTEKAIQVNPRLTRAYGNLAILRIRSGDYRAGIAALRDGLRLSPSEPGLARELAWWLAVSPDLTSAERREALTIAQSVAAAGPNDPVAQDTLATALAANGRFDEARELTRQILVRFSNLPPAQLADISARQRLFESRRPFEAPRLSTTSKP